MKKPKAKVKKDIIWTRQDFFLKCAVPRKENEMQKAQKHLNDLHLNLN